MISIFPTDYADPGLATGKVIEIVASVLPFATYTDWIPPSAPSEADDPYPHLGASIMRKETILAA